MQLNVEDLGVHMMTIVGHKFGAPKGVAALFISSRVTSDKMCSFFYGGGQEFGRRAGTENVLLVVRSRTLCFVEPANLAASLASAQELCIAGSSWCSGVGAGAQLTCFGCILGYLRSLHLQTTEQEQPSLTCLQAGMGAAAKVVQQELGAIKGTEPFNHPLPRGQLRNGFPPTWRCCEINWRQGLLEHCQRVQTGVLPALRFPCSFPLACFLELGFVIPFYTSAKADQSIASF
eukprot:scaffold9123_cov21-Tisochrysis_lutea.AAC.1